MPSRPAKYVLPTVIAPTDSVCYVVPVPNDPQHIAAFKGQIYDLAWSKKWQDDPTHEAADVARVWQEIFDNLEPCEVVNVRLKPTDFCMIQLTLDGGITWTDVADLSDCANAAATNAIDNAINDGLLAPGGQPGQGILPNPGFCVVYNIQISGSGAWHSPIPLQDGDTIQIENASGAWAEDIISLWYCANGQQFVLGVCADPPIVTGTDVLVSEPHMRLIAGYGATPTYVDAYDTTITIPGGAGVVDFWLQPNEQASVRAGNVGSIRAKITICRAGWTHTFDFASGAQGWAVYAGNGSFVTDHFECHAYDGSVNSGVIQLVYVPNITTEFLIMAWDYSCNDYFPEMDIRTWGSYPPFASMIHDYTDTMSNHASFTHRQVTFQADSPGTVVLLLQGATQSGAPILSVYRITVSGLGTEPTW